MPLLTEMARRKRLEWILGEVGRDSRVLDVGCGDGWLVRELRERGFRCVGLDLGGGDVRGSAYHLPFRDKSFDCVIAIEALEHVTEEADAEIQRVCRGKVIATSPAGRLSDWVIDLLIGVGLLQGKKTPHLRVVDFGGLRFGPPVKRRRLYLLDTYAVYDLGRSGGVS